jgi:ATP-dependent Lon protease
MNDDTIIATSDVDSTWVAINPDTALPGAGGHRADVLCMALTSLMTNRTVRSIAMTGKISLPGPV